nr:hypothetical protein [Pandoravirus belohorizontensis]
MARWLFVAASTRATDPRVSARFFFRARAQSPGVLLRPGRCVPRPRCLWPHARLFFLSFVSLCFDWSEKANAIFSFFFFLSRLGPSACRRVRFGRCRGSLPPHRSARRQLAQPRGGGHQGCKALLFSLVFFHCWSLAFAQGIRTATTHAKKHATKNDTCSRLLAETKRREVFKERGKRKEVHDAKD